MTIKIKTVLEYNLESMKSELIASKIVIIETMDRLKNLIQLKDFASYHSVENMNDCISKITYLSEILQKINRIEPDIKYFKNKALLLYKEQKTKS